MELLESGVFYIRKSGIEMCDWHKTRLSINFIHEGNQGYQVEGKEYLLRSNSGVIINEGRSFKTYFSGSKETVMITVAFKVGLAEQVFHAMTHTHEQLLDSPMMNEKARLEFLEGNRPLNSGFSRSLDQLLKGIRRDDLVQGLPEEFYVDMLENLIGDQFDTYRQINELKYARFSTRKEVFRRISWAVEYMHGHCRETMPIERIAKVACLSPHHFKRLFRDIHSTSPHQFLISLRLKKATDLLLHSNGSIDEVCRQVGFANTSSFIRQFKKAYLHTPQNFRRKTRLA